MEEEKEKTHYQKYKQTILNSQKKHFQNPENLEKRKRYAREMYAKRQLAYKNSLKNV